VIFKRKHRAGDRDSPSRYDKQEFFLQRTVFLLNVAVLLGLFYLSAVLSIRPARQITYVEIATILGAAILLFISSIQLIRVWMIRQKARAFDREAFLDELTGTLNRERFDEVLQDEIRRAGRYHYPLTLCSIDLDDFESYNQHFGKHVADELLKKFSNHFMGNIRSSDKLARYTEDEFTLLLPHTDLIRSEKVLARILNESLQKMDCTFSVGLTSYRVGETQAQFQMRAKLALQEAKKAGKKKIRCVIGHDGGHSILEL
jgi:diguanylate cyclase (GGDEF)-like protein